MKYWIMFLLFSLFLISCSSDPVADGDKAFAEGKYGPALNYYMQAKKTNPENAQIDEKIAYTYMKRGAQLYERTRNIDSFSGNFEKGEGFIPDNLSEEFKAQYSEMLFRLADAYYHTKPANEIQKEQYFTKTLDNLEAALNYDPQNTPADSLLASIKQENFQRMFDRGVEFYEQAKKERTNEELYLTAERYLNRAVFFNPDNDEAKKYLELTRKNTLRILDTDQDFPLAVAGIQQSGDFLVFDITGLNNTGAELEFNPNHMYVTDEAQNRYEIDSEQTAKDESGLTEPATLQARDRIDGILAFRIDKSVDPVYLSYEPDQMVMSKKYLP
jgi:ribosomal protein S16